MSSFIAYTIFGLFSGAAYAIAASGLVLTYTTTRVFNIAHGAFGMLLSFLFWDFSVRQGLPTWLSLILVLFIVAPAIGYFISRFVAKGLGDAPVSVSLVVTVALLVGCIGVASYVYKPEARTVPFFFESKSFSLGENNITAHQLITILTSIAVAFALFVLLTRTRIGTAMRAAVDNPELLKLFGGKPEQVAALSWMIGIALAGLGGILLVSTVGLDTYSLTLLVINAYAAAMLGRLKSLPLTFVGGMGLGLLTSYVTGYVQLEGALGQVKNVVPALFLFVVIVALPTQQLRIGQVRGLVSAPLPSLPKTLGWSAGLLVLVALFSGTASEVNLLLLGTAATYAIMMLSLVLLTGYGGHVSLAQFTFLGVGALAYSKLDSPNLFGLIVAALMAAGVGAVVAITVLRLTGLYLALATLAFASIMDTMVFQADFAFGFNGTLPAERLSLLGRSITSTGGYVFVMAVFFVVMSIILLTVRKGVIGRMLIAMRDSPAACGTLGLDMRWFRVGLFAASAGMAGMAGGLYAGLRQTVGAAEFGYFNSFLLLLLVVVAGVTSVTGAALGGAGLMLLKNYPDSQAVLFVVLAIGAILLARNPNGLAIYAFRLGRLLQNVVGPRLLASLPALPGRDEVGEADDPEVAAETASQNRDQIVEVSETVVTSTDGDAREVPANVK
ncbi:inner-membrane translocator [Nocardioides sp.]|uniref:branched-chain amino acid ABC transporter permease n=1 Tax=Nocardioides sp. TaxID=35761 RepID=UPI0035638972